MFSLFSSSEDDSASARLLRVEQKLDLILEHLGVAFEEIGEASGLPATAKRFADAGKKLEAIKAHRKATGSGLKEAKEAVEDYLRVSGRN